eukprot:7209681-Prymnesium_polylepis.2
MRTSSGAQATEPPSRRCCDAVVRRHFGRDTRGHVTFNIVGLARPGVRPRLAGRSTRPAHLEHCGRSLASARLEEMRECYIVSGAGDPETNGIYEVDTLRIGGLRSRGDASLCYRKVGSNLTMNYNASDGAWYLCRNHHGAWYRVESDSIEPPSHGWTKAKNGKAPTPSVRYAHSVGLTAVQPLTFRVKGARLAGVAEALDGLYVVDLEQGERDGVNCYRRVCGKETIHREAGSWWISSRHHKRSAWLEVRPPPRAP